MTVSGWLQIALFVAAVTLLTKPLGVYLYRVFEGERRPLPRLKPLQRLHRLEGGVRQAARRRHRDRR